jgi:hypothetical protein
MLMRRRRKHSFEIPFLEINYEYKESYEDYPKYPEFGDHYARSRSEFLDNATKSYLRVLETFFVMFREKMKEEQRLKKAGVKALAKDYVVDRETSEGITIYRHMLDGKPTGRIILKHDGTYFAGEALFKVGFGNSGIPHGWGYQLDRSGIQVYGEWVYGVAEGVCLLLQKNGDYLVSVMRSDKAYGVGLVIKKNGKRELQLFEDGKLTNGLCVEMKGEQVREYLYAEHLGEVFEYKTKNRGLSDFEEELRRLEEMIALRTKFREKMSTFHGKLFVAMAGEQVEGPLPDCVYRYSDDGKTHYFGQISANGMRHGSGLLLEGSEIFFGTWKDDSLNGWVYCMYEDGKIGFGEFAEDEQSGEYLELLEENIEFLSTVKDGVFLPTAFMRKNGIDYRVTLEKDGFMKSMERCYRFL